jgi:hypothetical protein
VSPAVVTLELTTVEHEELVAVLGDQLRGSDSFVRWRDAGVERDDIECIHAGNVIRSLERKHMYQKLRDPLMAKYGVSEFELVGATMHRFAVNRR